MSRTLILSALSVCLLSSAEYVVATTGSDGNPGTADRPFASIAAAVNRLAAGDTITVRGGTYNPTAPIGVWVSGTATQRITIRAQPGEQPVVDGSAVTGSYPNVFSIGGSYVTLQGFTVRNSRGIGIQNWKASGTRYLGNTVTDSQGSGIAIESDDLVSSNDILVEGNTVGRSCLNNQARTWDGGWGMGINLGRANRVTVRGNLSYDNWGEGIGCYLSDACVVTGNTVRNAYSVSLYLDNATNCVVEGNLAFSTGNTDFYRYGHPANGFQTANEDYGSQSNPSKNNIVRNNIFSNLRCALYYGSYGRGGGMQGLQFLDNTCSGASEVMIAIDADTHTGTVIGGNVFRQTAGMPMLRLAGSLAGVSAHHNAWSGGSGGALASSGDVNADPQLTNPAGTSAADFRPLSDSPLIDAGANFVAVASDRDGTARPQGVAADIGAFEVVPTFGLRVNFQPATALTVAGWVVDSGAVYGTRQGATCGWNAVNESTRDRNAALSPDQRYDTVIHMQKPANPTARWEAAVSNGVYEVRLLAGDPSFYDSVFAFSVEGVETAAATPTSSNRWAELSVRINVQDGRLTVRSAAAARNNKLCSIEIVAQPSANN